MTLSGSLLLSYESPYEPLVSYLTVPTPVGVENVLRAR